MMGVFSKRELSITDKGISLINMWIIDTKNKKSEQKKSKSKHVKLLLFGLIVYVLSRILHGQFH
jgi:hypothetical protein